MTTRAVRFRKRSSGLSLEVRKNSSDNGDIQLSRRRNMPTPELRPTGLGLALERADSRLLEHAKDDHERF
jgi:hypothetical protein